MPKDQMDTDQDDAAAQADQGDQTDQDQVDTDQQADQKLQRWFCAAPPDPEPDPEPDPDPDPDPEPDPEPSKPFTPEQEQYMQSWMGRTIKKHVEEGLAPLIKDRQAAPASTDGSDPLKKFNEELSEQLFAGDLTGAIDKAMTVREKAQSNLASANKIETDRAITQFSEDPLYKDIYQDMHKIAHETAAGGFPPEAAARYALAQAKTNHYESKNANPDAENLAMAGGGQQRQKPKEIKLAPEFKKAFERDKADGLFKTEEEYIDKLSPEIRTKYGMI